MRLRVRRTSSQWVQRVVKSAGVVENVWSVRYEFILFRVEGDNLVDAAPIPIARTSLQASGHGVPRPGLRDGRERGDNEVGEERRKV